MKESEALKRILITWVITYLMHSKLDCLHDAIEPVQEHGDEKIKAACLIFFGTQSPTYEILNVFHDKYVLWVEAIEEKWEEIVLGNITLDEIIVEQVTKETWL